MTAKKSKEPFEVAPVAAEEKRAPSWRDPALPVDYEKISVAIERIFNDGPRVAADRAAAA
jgi:hypothetical protein